ncbi:MAG: HAD family phosphatase [Paludibacteraceae bacterium]|nr:HAD family phosphatase [Paludibacteraceae bacterium]
MRYTTIIFDFGKVLVDYDFGPAIKKYIPTKELQMEFASVFCSDDFINQCDLGFKTVPELMQELVNEHPVFAPIIRNINLTAGDIIPGEVEGMRMLLTELKMKGVRLLGLTNWSASIYEVMEAYPEMFSLLDGRMISSEEHLIKPDIRIYESLIRKFHLHPSECLFVDDKAVNIEGAVKAGLNGHQFKGASDLRAFLTQSGINLS